ncbi:MAG TPA: ATP-binding cassette domain-containing protein, partial [Methylomirabilota bacterium]|nr:ATP-binding cassette domain-containing protein [Methylomirabilota bacterium]
MTIVRLRNVDKVYSTGVVALQGLDLDVAEGEFLTLLGPSGCGKSTVLRLVAGLGDLSGGSIEWRAADGGGAPPRDLGFVFQDPTLMPWATGADNVRLPLRLRGVPREAAAARVAEAIGMVGLDGFERAYPRELSG